MKVGTSQATPRSPYKNKFNPMNLPTVVNLVCPFSFQKAAICPYSGHRIHRTKQDPPLGSPHGKRRKSQILQPTAPSSLRSTQQITRNRKLRLGGFDDGLGVAVQKKLAGLVGDKCKKPK